MRGGRTFLFLLVVALGLGAYIYFVENKRTPSDTPAKDKVFTADTSKIDTIEVKASSGDTTTIKKNGTDWQIVAPQTMDADASTVATLVSTLESLDVGRTVSDNPTSVKEYGLEPPKYTVGFKLAGETAMHTLDVGDKTPTGSDLYARVEGQPKLMLIGAFNGDSLNKTTFDLRDKTILKFLRDAVDSVKIESTNPTIDLVRKADEWRLTQPVSAKADFGTVDGIVGQMAQARMKTIEMVTPGPAAAGQPPAMSPADLKKYGFDKPQVVATVGAGSNRATLQIGGKKDDVSVYARDMSRPLTVFGVDTTLMTGLARKADELRVKDVFEFRSFSAQSVDITLDGQTYSLAKEKAPPKPAATPATTPTPSPAATPEAAQDVWKLKKPTAKDLDQTKVNDLLSALSNLRADKFADKPLTTGSEIVVVAKFGDAGSAKEEKITFRKAGDVVQATRQGDGGAAIIPTADFDKVMTQLKELAGAK
jgi:hypothetical protein